MIRSLERLGEQSMVSSSSSLQEGIHDAPSQQFGDFAVGPEIGRGGMGIVYEATQRSLNRPVAIKILPRLSSQNATQIARFQTEARAAASLAHRNIVPAYCFGCEGAIYFIAMQLIRGVSLDRLIASMLAAKNSAADGHAVVRLTTGQDVPLASFMPPFGTVEYFRWVARIGVSVADALEHAHQHGIIHRDVKPGNIIVDMDGVPWLTDFGLAQIDCVGHGTLTGDVVGTLRYMSPEQSRGRKHAVVDHRSDVYSLGCTLYELATMTPVFGDEGREVVLDRILCREPTTMRRIVPSVPRDLETIIHKALRKDVGERYGAAHELQEDLLRFLDNKPTLARPLSRSAKAYRWAKRHHLPVILTCIATISLGLLALGGWWANRQLGAQVVQINQLKVTAEAAAERAEASLRREKLLTYADQLHVIKLAIEQGEYRYAQDRLQRLAAERPGRADFVWSYLNRQVNCFRHALHGDGGAVHAVDYSPSGNRVATGDATGGVRVWYRSSPVVGEKHRCHDGNVNAVLFLTDELFLSGGEDGVLARWSASGRAKGRQQAHCGALFCIAATTDRAVIASGGEDGMVRLWNGTNLESIGELSGHTDWVRALVFSPNGRWLYSGGHDGTVRVWDVHERRLVKTITPDREFVMSLAISFDGRYLAMGCKKRSVRLWDVAADAWSHECNDQYEGWIRSVAFAPTGKTFVAIDNHGRTHEWEVATGEHVRSVPVLHDGEVRSMALSPEGEEIVTAGVDGTARVWKLGGGFHPVAWTFGHKELVDFDAAQDRVMLCEGRYLYSISPVPFRIVGKQRAGAFHPIRADMTGDAQWVFALGSAGGRRGIVRRLHTNSRYLDHPKDLIYAVPDVELEAIACHPSGSSFVALHANSLYQFQAEGSAPVRRMELPDDVIEQIEYSPDGRLLIVATSSGRLLVYDANQWSLLHDLPDREGATFTANGEILAAAGADRRIRLYDVHGGTVRQELAGHERPIEGLAFDPSGDLLASVDDSGVIRVWELSTGREMLQLDAGGDPLGLAFTADGQTLVAGRQGTESDADAQLLIWDCHHPPTPVEVAGGG